ncbi:hypothetical protein GH714_000005 [Hevea brasiliensis]|uniref:Uncharacterized protein n=1 Tax=Hevea brasiliensis TaxID=3981 RepID=A0A6A6N9G3_HEVBR|nr:hypothetical protein GH714_000005 [Hevea brasiliensis]
MIFLRLIKCMLSDMIFLRSHSANKKHVLADLGKTNDETTKDLEEWRNLESEMKQAIVDWVGAKEKLALANVRWKLFKEDLGLGKFNIS